MNILAFDTSFAMCSVAVSVGGPRARVEALAEPMAQGHAERLLPMISEMLAAAGLTVADIDRIAVTNGPGTFTGTRIAVAAARGLTLATARPIVAVSSLHLVAEDPVIEPKPGRDLGVVLNAGRGEVYAQLFDGETREPKEPPRLLTVASAAAMSVRPVLAVGSGAALVEAAARSQGRDLEAALPDLLPIARNMIVLASRTLPLADPVRPLYLRPPDAKPQDGKSLARAEETP